MHTTTISDVTLRISYDTIQVAVARIVPLGTNYVEIEVTFILTAPNLIRPFGIFQKKFNINEVNTASYVNLIQSVLHNFFNYPDEALTHYQINLLRVNFDLKIEGNDNDIKVCKDFSDFAKGTYVYVNSYNQQVYPDRTDVGFDEIFKNLE